MFSRILEEIRKMNPKDLESELLKGIEKLFGSISKDTKQEKEKEKELEDKQKDQAKKNEEHEYRKKLVSPSINENVRFLDPNYNALAMTDLTGRTASKTDFFKNNDFVCFHCLQPMKNKVCLSLPIRMKKLSHKKDMIEVIVRGRFGSIACLKAYALNRKLCFPNENAEIITFCLMHVWGVSIENQSKIKPAPKRTEMRQFCSWLEQDSKEKDYVCGSYESVTIKLPNAQKSIIHEEHTTALINSHITHASKIKMTKKELLERFPNFLISI